MNDRSTPARIQPRQSWLTFVALLGGILLALQPLLAGHLPWRGDGLLHVYRLVELERAAGQGVLFPRWLPDLGYGFGFPLFNYYAPLSYYLLLALRGFGLPVVAALQFGYALALVAISLGVFLWARAIFGSIAGLVAAFAAVYAPYVLYDALHRGVLAELWGLAFLALSLAALEHHVRQRTGRTLLWLVLAYAALVLTHNILALTGSALLLAYALFLLGRPGAPARPATSPGRERLTTHPFVALALGLGLATFFWLPALAERDLVQIEQLYGPANFFYGNNFLSPTDLVALPQPADPAQVNPSLAFGLGIPQLLFALVAWRPRADPPLTAGQRRHRLALTVAIALLLAMTLPASRFIWDRLPLLYFVQFPWRFLGPVSLLLAVLAGAGASRLPGSPVVQLGASLLPLAVAGLPWLFPGGYQAELALAPDAVIRFEAETGWLGTTSAAEYLPVQVETLPAPETLLPLYEAAAPDYLIPRLDSGSIPASAELLDARYGLTDANVSLAAAAPFQVRFLWYYFPGWQLQLNGEPHPVAATGPHGLLAAEIPAGEHTLALSFDDTPIRRWSGYVSVASLLALLIAARLQRGGGPAARRVPPAPGVRATGTTLVLGLLLFSVKIGVLDHYPNPFARAAFDGQTVRGVQVPLQVSFGDELALLGYDLDEQPVPPDGVVDVTLYWRAQTPLATDYSIAVHLVDELGRRYGQQDSYHPAGYPTSRWLPGEYARDVHRLPLLYGTPPGTYRLLVSVYEASSGRRLEVRGAAQGAPGAAYPLAEVSVLPRVTRAEPASLPIEQQTNWNPTGAIGLLGYNGPPDAVDVGSPLAMTFFWQAAATTASDYQAHLYLVTEEGETAATLSWAPGRASYPTSSWPAGAVVRDERALLVPAVRAGRPDEAVESGRYHLLLALSAGSEGSLQGEPLSLGTLNVVAPARSFDLPGAPTPALAQVGDIALLAGYDLSTTQLQAGDDVTVHVYWRAAALTTTSYTVFVHLVGPEDTIIAQRDQLPAGGDRPTTGWLPGEVISDSYTLSIPAAATPGSYRLRLGMYDAASGQRLPVSGAGIPSGDHLFLPEQIEVEGDG
jgi:hypothetical protein